MEIFLRCLFWDVEVRMFRVCFVLADSNLIKSLHNCFCAFIFNFMPNSIRKKKIVNEQNLITSRMYRRKSFIKSSNHRENFTLKLILKKKNHC